MKKSSILALMGLLFLVTFSPSVAKAEKALFKDDNIRAELSLINKRDNLPLKGALEIVLAHGWHTYWRVPGDSGLPPVFSWAQSENVESVEITWPVPQRKKEMEFHTFGFDDSMSLILRVQPKDKTKPVKLVLNAQIMICKDICIPQKFDLTLPFEIKTNVLEKQKLYYALYPKGEETKFLKIGSVIAAKEKLVVNITSKFGFENMDVIPVIEEDMLGLANPPVLKISEEDPNKAMFEIDIPANIENLARHLEGKTLTLIVAHDGKAIQKSIEY